jgi:WD40 repeat protein
MRKRYLLLILLFIIYGWVCLFSLTSEPILMINTDMHNVTIVNLSVDASENLLLSCAQDKTARLWDLDTGELVRVLHIPIDFGNQGSLYACALSPKPSWKV